MKTASGMGAREWGFLIVGSMLWGSAYFFNAVAIAELPHLTILALRLAFAVSVLMPLTLLLGLGFPRRLPDLAPFFVMTLFSNVVPYLLVLRGQTGTSGGLAAILGATTPLFTMVLAHIWTADERLHAHRLAGVLVGIGGVAVVVGPDVWRGWSASLEAKLALLSASILYAVGSIYAKRLIHHPPIVLANTQMTCGLIVTLPLALLIDLPWAQPQPSPAALGAVMGVGVLGSALAAIAYFQVFTRAGASNAMLTALLVPVTPILLGGLFLGEQLTLREALGFVVIAAALLIIDGRILGPLR
jgi:drug/metabolite transporter (DMT)-like permease